MSVCCACPDSTEYTSALRVFYSSAIRFGMAAPVPFKIDIPEEALKDLRERLLRARLPEPLEGVGWKYGTEYNYLKVRKAARKQACHATSACSTGVF